MSHCPSQDWDRYAADQEAGEFGKWAYEVSKKIAQVDPFWNAMEEALNAIADDEIVTWSNGIKVNVPYDDALEPDDVALIIRTLHAKGRKVKVFPFDDAFAIRVEIPEASPEWRIVPNSENLCDTELELNNYLEFCLSVQSFP